MPRVKVKICGIRTLEEANAAVEAGADALGFNFWSRSARFVEPSIARSIIQRVGPLTSTVGVFVDEDANRIAYIAAELGLSAVQLHGDESPEFCERLKKVRRIKALRVGPDFDVKRITEYRVEMILLDAGVKGSYGGTGHKFDWEIAVEAKKHASIILAGGLTADNVVEAITRVSPAAIDVCSGVEAEPGRKDLDELRRFMRTVAHANAMIASDSDEIVPTGIIR
jgi:phosphoribosylanthranilate isomerase